MTVELRRYGGYGIALCFAALLCSIYFMLKEVRVGDGWLFREGLMTFGFMSHTLTMPLILLALWRGTPYIISLAISSMALCLVAFDVTIAIQYKSITYIIMAVFHLLFAVPFLIPYRLRISRYLRPVFSEITGKDDEQINLESAGEPRNHYPMISPDPPKYSEIMRESLGDGHYSHGSSAISLEASLPDYKEVK